MRCASERRRERRGQGRTMVQMEELVVVAERRDRGRAKRFYVQMVSSWRQLR